ncbi:MAG TPA: hypothetical protein VFN82_00815 [Solirubrobacterales bacterium]|nr:hypothetical protein [Solirubrobacterales bacterium]
MRSRASRAALAWAAVAAASFGLWMLLADSREAPQVVAGLLVAAVAATGSELVRRQQLARLRLRGGWLLRSWRPPANVPRDLWRLTVALARPARPGAPAGGRFRAIRFQAGDDPEGRGREALAELAGSFSPNTYVVGLDRERGVLLVHQLVPEEDEDQAADSIDPLGLR